ncbi:MAG: cobalamin-binding protein, partial [Clostridiales bacterium]|nr:cobalamin-binding protein [Clostridiales bacterium]
QVDYFETSAFDLHDIGKNLVVMMVEGAGFEVIDLGVDATPAKFVEVVKADPEVKIVGLSALLTTTMPAMKRIIDALAEAGVRDQVKVLVGGAPVTDSYAKEIGADGYSEDAAGAADLAKSFVA